MATRTKLTFTLPDGAEHKYLLSRDGMYTIGSSADNDIPLPDSGIAAEYGKFAADETDESRWFLQVIESGLIIVLEDGSEEQVGSANLVVSITSEASAPAAGTPAPVPPPAPATAVPAESEPSGVPDNHKQLEELRKVQEMRDFTSAAIMIVTSGILAFLAGVAWRIIQ
ncbi:MAG: hypothetical protein ACR2RV_02150 [Verrucomicrobiales bacterium]